MNNTKKTAININISLPESPNESHDEEAINSLPGRVVSESKALRRSKAPLGQSFSKADPAAFKVNKKPRPNKNSFKENKEKKENVTALLKTDNKSNLPVPRPASQPPVSLDPLRAYLAEVRQYKLLSREEEDKLLKAYQKDGDPNAAKKIITGNLRLVIKIAMDFQSHWLNNLLDLIQEGNVGLMQALKKYDPGRGVKFSYYASYWIKAYILKHIMDNWRMVKVGTTQAQRKLFYNLRKERDKIIQEGLTPAVPLLAERLGVTEADVVEMDMRLSAGREVSLDAPVSPDSEQTQISLLPSENQGADTLLASRQLKELLKDKLDLFKETIAPRELIILEKRLLAETPVTLQEIGEEFGISRERVRQLEERLKNTLKIFLRKEMPELDELRSIDHD